MKHQKMTRNSSFRRWIWGFLDDKFIHESFHILDLWTIKLYDKINQTDQLRLTEFRLYPAVTNQIKQVTFWNHAARDWYLKNNLTLKIAHKSESKTHPCLEILHNTKKKKKNSERIESNFKSPKSVHVIRLELHRFRSTT